jgi:hypothetical protein
MRVLTPLTIVLNGDNCWPDLKERGFVEGAFVGLARLPNGTEGGKSAVTARIELANGQVILAQTTFALLRAAVQAFDAADNVDNLGKQIEHIRGNYGDSDDT